MANAKPATPTIVEIPEEEEDLEFLCQIEAAEAQARSLSASSSKRRRISIVDDLQVKLERDNDFVEEIEEGAYTAALKGSKSLTWKRNQQLQSSKTLTKPYESSMNSGSGVGSGGGGGGGGGGACFRCGKEGHWARDCSQITSSVACAGPEVIGSTVAVVAEKACPCGLGICLVLTANTERNRGRKFYRCPVRQENGGCNFFEWCDISSGNYSSAGVQGEKAWKNGTQQQYYQHPTNQGFPAFTNSWNDYDKGASSPGFSYGGTQKSDIAADSKGYGTRTGSTCFKCGEEGHWARDCPSSSTPSDGLRGKASFDVGRGNPSSGACFKCGQSGHWARDCTQPQSTTVRNW